jgi:hypothetical protein
MPMIAPVDTPLLLLLELVVGLSVEVEQHPVPVEQQE